MTENSKNTKFKNKNTHKSSSSPPSVPTKDVCSEAKGGIRSGLKINIDF
jgi:hypothetical protein